MTKSSSPENRIVEFLRKRDYRLVKELGQGACGKTVLLHDDLIDEHFVCKRYTPFAEEHRQQLFANFVREIKLLHQLYHKNVVRIFNYYLYPDHFTGYILMEFVDGSGIDEYVSRFPEKINEVFFQAISGFRYLEACEILHRDIRPQNLMVCEDGTVKIIDLGFGKQVQAPEDFEKSIHLNLWCQPPNEFASSIYDFRSEVYFVGKLFEQLITGNKIGHFKYLKTLGRMCQPDPGARIERFFDVEKEIWSERFSQVAFGRSKLASYRAFADAVCRHITKIENGTRYVADVGRIQTQLGDAYRRFMLEDVVPDAALVLRCFSNGTYYYIKTGFPVQVVKDFLSLLESSREEQKRTVLANLHTRLDAIPRYSETPAPGEIPF